MFATCTKYKEYKARRPQKTVFYSVVKKYLLSWLKRNEGAIPRHVEKEFRDYQKCGIHAHGFAVAECNQCNHEFIIPFSCRCRGVCPSCSTKRMVKTAAHLVDHVCPIIPYRQWVISFPWPLRKYFNVPEILKDCLSIVAQEINRCLIERSPQIDGAQFGGVGFVHRFGAKLNFHPHFHFCCTDGVFGKEGDQL